MHHRTAFTLVVMASATAAVPAAAQIVYPGDTRVEMSDVSGPPLTSGDMLGPGTVRSFTCPVAWGVRTAADIVVEQLRNGSIRLVAPPWAGRMPSDGVRQDLLLLLTDGEGDDAAASRLRDSLAPGEATNAVAREAAEGLVERLDGLLENAVRVRPERPGHRTATQLASVVGAYNDFLEKSSAELLSSPPEALLAIQAALSPLVIAALENEGREVARQVGSSDLACAPPTADLVPPPPAPPIERATVVCVLAADGLRAMGAIVLSSGDTVVAVDGRRVPLAEAYPTSIAYAADAPWYAQSDAITVNGRRYVRFGLPRLAAPAAALRRVGEYQGVPLFAEPGEDHLVVPVRPDCLIQDYRPERELRVRG